MKRFIRKPGAGVGSSTAIVSTSSTAGSMAFSLIDEEDEVLRGAKAVAVEIAARAMIVRIILNV